MAALFGATAAALSAAVGGRFAGDPALPAWWWLAMLSLVLSLIDLAHHRLPHAWVAILAAGGIVVFAVLAVQAHSLSPLVRLSLAICLVLGGGLAAQWIFPGHIGMGDTLLLAALTPYWAWHSWPTVLEGLISGHLVLGVVGAAAWLAGVRGGQRIAAGPALLLGAWLPLL